MTQNFYCSPNYKTLQNKLKIFSPMDLRRISEEAETINVGNRGAVVLSKLYIDDTCSLYIKMYYYKKPNFRYWGRISRATREKLSYDFFSTAEIPHPDVVFCGEHRVLGKLHWAIIATREITNSTDFVKLFLDPKNNADMRTNLLHSLGALAGKMHKHKFVHGTFRFRNTLCIKDSGKIFFIDCPGGAISKIPWRRSQIFDLICIYKDIRALCSTEEWNTFLTGYSEKTNTTISAWDLIPKLCLKKFGPPPKIDWNNLEKTDGMFR